MSGRSMPRLKLRRATSDGPLEASPMFIAGSIHGFLSIHWQVLPTRGSGRSSILYRGAVPGWCGGQICRGRVGFGAQTKNPGRGFSDTRGDRAITTTVVGGRSAAGTGNVMCLCFQARR